MGENDSQVEIFVFIPIKAMNYQTILVEAMSMPTE